MAIIKIFTLSVIFSLANKAVIEASKIEERSPLSPIDIPPKTSHEEKKFYLNCEERIKEKCGKPIFSKIVYNGNKRITPDCCRNLVLAGPRCYDGLIGLITSLPEFKARASTILTKSKQIWNRCILDAEYGA